MEANWNNLSWLPEELMLNDILKLWTREDAKLASLYMEPIQEACINGELPCEGDPRPKWDINITADFWPPTSDICEIEARKKAIFLFRSGLGVKIKRDDFKGWLIKQRAWPLPPEIPLSAWFKGEGDYPTHDDETESLHKESSLPQNMARLTRSSLHRERARKHAVAYWDRKLNAGLDEVVGHIKGKTDDPFDGDCYSDKTIRDWIRDLSPTYTPGKPGRKSTR